MKIRGDEPNLVLAHVIKTYGVIGKKPTHGQDCVVYKYEKYMLYHYEKTGRYEIYNKEIPSGLWYNKLFSGDYPND